MIPERDNQRLSDMVTYARYAVDMLGGADAQSLSLDLKTQLAVRHAVEIVDEAASKVPDSVRAMAPQLPWRSIVGMRNTLIHGYGNIDLERLVVVVNRDLPPLIADLERLLGEPDT